MKNKVLVIGDSCDDIFVYGECKRLNPEAPTPVFNPIREIRYDGMAANLFNNLISLDCHVDFVTNPEKIIKKRLVEEKSNYILIRIDEEPSLTPLKLQDDFISNLKLYDAVVVSDYNKGFLNEETLETIFENSFLSFIDTKKNFGSWIRKASFIKVNESEYNNPNHDKAIMKEISHKLIVTLGGNGCKFNEKIYPTSKSDIIDVVGAGDSFFAGFISTYINSKDIDTSISFANMCGTYAVKQKGITTLNNMV